VFIKTSFHAYNTLAVLSIVNAVFVFADVKLDAVPPIVVNAITLPVSATTTDSIALKSTAISVCKSCFVIPFDF